jgi:hypothetical protein
VGIVDEAIRTLTDQRANLRAAELVGVLVSLGFSVRPASIPNHFVVKHAELENFPGANFAAGHGRNGNVKPVYVSRMRRLIEERADELRILLEQ